MEWVNTYRIRAYITILTRKFFVVNSLVKYTTLETNAPQLYTPKGANYVLYK